MRTANSFVRLSVCLSLVLCGFAGGADAQVVPQTTTPATGANSPPAGVNTPPKGPAPQEDPLTTTDQRPGTPIAVTLGDSFFRTRLPFDIPFDLTVTTSDQDVTRMSVNLYEIGRQASAAALANELERSRNCLSSTAQSIFSTTARRSTANTFILHFDDLEPQRYYVLCFVSRGPVPAKAIEDDARRILRETATTLILGTPANQQPSDIDTFGNEIYAKLQESIERLGNERSVPAEVPEGNIFRRGTRIVVGSRFALRLVPFAGAYRQLDVNAPIPRAFREGRERLRQAVAAASTAPTADRLTQEIRDLLPPEDLELPDRTLAIRSSDALNLSNYDFERVRILLTTTASNPGPAPNGPVIAAALNEVLAGLEDVSDAVARYAVQYNNLRTATEQMLQLVALESLQVTVAFGSSVLTADMNRNAYVSLDAGIAYPWRLANMVFYAGTNIYFRPINKEAPLRYKGTFLHRFALTIGVTTTVKDDSRRAIDLRATPNDKNTTNSLLFGGGFRVTPSIRIGAGALVFKEKDPNPLIDQTSLTATPYVSFAVDVNVAAIFKSFFP
jgi:hypothetical protein